MPDEEPPIPKHGGYRKLKSFQIARLVYDMTFRFCELYVDKRGRTHDQMVQAARSGVQNIAEGSMDSATSKKIELNLTNIARGSLEELRDDYEDFLRHRGLPEFAPDHPALTRFKKMRCATLQEVQKWVADELKHHRTDLHGPTRTNTDTKDKPDQAKRPSPCSSVSVRVGPCSPTPPSAILAANAALALINLASYLLKRQVESQGETFTEEGGFSERLYRIRSERRRKKRED
jgi:four helix bundle suffix protein